MVAFSVLIDELQQFCSIFRGPATPSLKVQERPWSPPHANLTNFEVRMLASRVTRGASYVTLVAAISWSAGSPEKSSLSILRHTSG